MAPQSKLPLEPEPSLSRSLLERTIFWEGQLSPPRVVAADPLLCVWFCTCNSAPSKVASCFPAGGGPAPRTDVCSLCRPHFLGFGWKCSFSWLIPVSSDDILQRLPNLLPFYGYSKRPHVGGCHQTGRRVPSPCQLKLRIVIYRETLWLRVFASHRTSFFSHYEMRSLKFLRY